MTRTGSLLALFVFLCGNGVPVFGQRNNGQKIADQRQPVTLEALHEWRARARPDVSGDGASADSVPGEPVWAPDGKTFVFRQANKLMLYDVAAKRTREVTSLTSLDQAAVSPASSQRYSWENRRVDEQSIQWEPSGREVLYQTNGDLFLIVLRNGRTRQITKTDTAERDPKLSPDGRHVAFVRDWDLYTIDLGTGLETRLTVGGSDEFRNGAPDWVYPEELDLGTAYWWAPDSRSIAYLQFDTSSEPLYPHEDLRGTRAIFEPQRYPQAGENNPRIRLGVVSTTRTADGEGRVTKWLDVGDTVDAFLVARVGWVPASKNIYVVRTNRVQNQLEFLVYDSVSGKSSTVYRETDPYWVNVEGAPVFLKDGGRFLWTSERDGFRHIYMYRLDGADPKQLTRGPGPVTNIAGVDESAQRVYYTAGGSNPLDRHLYSIRFDGAEPASIAALITTADGTHRISMAPGCGSFLDTYSSLKTPPETKLYSVDASSKAVQLSIYRPADRRPVDQLNLLPSEIHHFPNADGQELYARLIKPAGFDPSKKYPVIVNVYGGPHAQSVRNAWPGVTLDQVFATKGYLVWEVDNRGTSGRGHAFETPVAKKLGVAELADQSAGIAYLVSLGFADPARIGVTGWSYGGFMTLNMLLNAPDLFRAGFAGAPVTNWMNYDTIYTERYMGLPKENRDAYARTSLPSKAGNLRGKLMIAHNIEDDNVLFQNTLQMISALETAGKQFELSLYTQKTHGVSGAEARQMEAAMLDFFDRSLGPVQHPGVSQ